MTVRALFACGHEQAIDPAKVPVCVRCGQTRVVRCAAPAPSFVGHVRGPVATWKDLGPATVTLTQDKDETYGHAGSEFRPDRG